MYFNKDNFFEGCFVCFLVGNDEKTLMRYVMYLIGIICIPLTFIIGVLYGFSFDK